LFSNDDVDTRNHYLFLQIVSNTYTLTKTNVYGVKLMGYKAHGQCECSRHYALFVSFF